MKVALDAGALIAFERCDRAVVALLARAIERGEQVLIPAGVIGQVWRDGRRQARLARLLSARQVTVVALDDRRARAAGQLCGVAGTTDVIDASLARLARDTGAVIVTSDPKDLARLDPSLRIITC